MLKYEEIVALCEAKVEYCDANRRKAETEGKIIDALAWGKATIEIQHLYLDILSRIKSQLEKEVMDQALQNRKESA